MLGIADDDSWSIETEVFDGPLDLLLYLVRRDGVNLRELAITPIADAYLEYVERMRELHLGVAAEYLVMAATLVYLKSLELLPRLPTNVEEEEEGVDPREALAKRLIEYERFRVAAEQLEARDMLNRDVFAREPLVFGDDERPFATDLDAFGLLDLYYELLCREVRATPEVSFGDSGPDVGTCCRRVLVALGGPGQVRELGEVLRGFRTMPERVVSFIGVLEMARLSWVDVRQEVHLGPVWIESRVSQYHSLVQLVGSVDGEDAQEALW